jgi:hypothetical protein
MTKKYAITYEQDGHLYTLSKNTAGEILTFRTLEDADAHANGLEERAGLEQGSVYRVISLDSVHE